MKKLKKQALHLTKATTFCYLLLQTIFLALFPCQAFAAPLPEMRSPKDIELSGLQRQASLASPIGRIELRWTRESERLFGKTPERATIEAANAVAKALKQSSFPSNVKNLNLNWQIVFLSKELKQGQVPDFLLSNCHPGWMTPPANIYIASEQAAGACGSQSAMTAKVADAQLARVLTHELGHSVEYALAPYAARDRARSEGFATWFEFFAGRFSNLLDSNLILSEQKFLARQRASIPDQSFQGGAGDYALASVLFHLLNENRSVADLSRVYDLMTSSHLSFLQSFTKVTGWSELQLQKRINSFLGLSS